MSSNHAYVREIPDPEAWPECRTCGTAWVLRRYFDLAGKWAWIWQRDCKHKVPDPKLVMANEVNNAK